MATFTLYSASVNRIMSTAITIPANIVESCDLDAGWSMLDTEGSSAGEGWIVDLDNVYFTSSTSFSSAHSSGTKLTINNLCENAGKTIYLLFDPDDMNSSFNSQWTVNLSGTIEFTTRPYTAGRGAFYVGSSRVKYPAFGLYFSQAYVGSKRIYHSTVTNVSAKPTTGLQGPDGLMVCPVSVNYTFYETLKPYDVEVTTTSMYFDANSLSVNYSYTTGKVEIRGNASTQNTITFSIRALYAW